VEVDGAPAKAKLRPKAGQRVRVRPAPPPVSEAVPQDIPLDVVHEDPHLVVVDKPAGMVVHPGPGHPDGTLVNAVLHHFGWLPGDDPERPGIVHRLDALTSGLLVVARTEEAKRGLVALFQAHDIERAYLAIATGHPPAKVTWDTLHGRHPRDRKKLSSKVRRGKRAVTHLEVLERLRGERAEAALVRCTLETGRTHQIRVHCADHGCPILGDPVYGRRPKDPRLRAAADALGRQALHAAVLGFVHPVTGERLHFEREPPPDFRRALEALRADR
jgi:23S rRNA pseudouridine1911/1915/1917 synthase